jgi:hypothetical protein
MVLGAHLSSSPTPSFRPAPGVASTVAAISGQNAPHLQPARAVEPVSPGIAQRAAGPTPVITPQIVPLVTNSGIRLTAFTFVGAPVGSGIGLDLTTVQNPKMFAQKTKEMLHRIGADPKTIEHGVDLAAIAAEGLRQHFPASSDFINAPVAAFGLVNSGVGFKRAYKRGDRFEMGHYALDGAANTADLAGYFTTVCTEVLTHTAASTGSIVLHHIAFAFRLFKQIYLFTGPAIKPGPASTP